MFWIVAGVILAGALALILRTLTVRTAAAREAVNEAEDEIDVCRAQLAELGRDVAAGLVPAEDAAASRAGIERRLLDADRKRQEHHPVSTTAESARARMGVIVVVALVPVAALGLYLYLGHPGMTGGSGGAQPPGPETRTAAAEKMPGLDALAVQLEERLKASPEDVRGWSLLGRTYMVLNEYSKSAEAYRRAIALQPDRAELQSGLGEAIVLSSDRQVTPVALAAFEQARKLDPADSAARYYLGLADYQRGKFREAMDEWVALARDAPADAPWLSDLRKEITAVANQLGLDPKSVLPESPSTAPKSTDPAKEMAALAERLNGDPKDYEGWIRLARLRAGAGDRAGARRALDAGRETYADAPFVLQMFARTASELGLDNDNSDRRKGPTAEDMEAASQMSAEDRKAMIEGMVAGLAARLEKNPDDPEGWRMLARSWGVLGQPEKSAEALGRLAEVRPEDAAAQEGYAMALVQIDEARGGKMSDRTVAALKQVIRLDKDNAQAHFYLGNAADQRGARAEAEQHWRNVIRVLPESSALRRQAEAGLEAVSGDSK